MKRNEKTERNRNIYINRIEGMSYRKIAENNGISIIRVRQIIEAEKKKVQEAADGENNNRI